MRGDWSGTEWGFGWKANFYARLGRGDHPRELIMSQLRGFIGDNFCGTEDFMQLRGLIRSTPSSGKESSRGRD